MTSPKHIILHHAAHPTADLKLITKWHKDRGFADVGYHFFIDKTGRIQSGRDEGTMGAHCRAGGMNRKSIGICLQGHFNNERPTIAQHNALYYLCNYLKLKHSIESILGHKEVEGASTECPGANVDMDLMRDFINKNPING